MSIRLHVLSDLHLECAPFTPPATEADVVLLAGDIHMGSAGVEWAEKHFPDSPVIYVMGNHEFYRHSIPELTETLKAKTKGSRIHLLEDDAVEIGGFTFLGCTLWTDFQYWDDSDAAMMVADQSMWDFHVIRMKPSGASFRPWRSAEINANSVGWLKHRLDPCNPARTVVVTHHAPSPQSIPPIHARSPLNAAFVSDLEFLIKETKPALWIHGHTHFNVDYTVGKTRVLSNQRGYPQQPVAGFDPSLVITLRDQNLPAASTHLR